MPDAKNWILLIVLINLILLPVMWMRQERAESRQQVLGATEKVNSDGVIVESKSGDIMSWVNSNLWGENKNTPKSSSSNGLLGENYSQDLPLRNNLPTINPEDGLKSMITSKEKSLSGKLVLRSGFKGNLAVKSYVEGDKVKIKCGDKEIVQLVDSSFLAPEGVIAVGSNQLFSNLGADPESTKELDCSINLL